MDEEKYVVKLLKTTIFKQHHFSKSRNLFLLNYGSLKIFLELYDFYLKIRSESGRYSYIVNYHYSQKTYIFEKLKES